MREAAKRLLPPQLLGVIQVIDQPFLQPIYDLESRAMAFDRVALIGDAAFVIRPHVGGGIAKAAADAAVLAAALDRHASIAEGLAAFQQFAALDCWGSFSNSSLRQTFLRACQKVGLTGVRPYDLRHSFGTAMYALTGDVRATGELLMHSSRKTTDRYTIGGVPQRLRLAVSEFNRMAARPKLAGTRGWRSRRNIKTHA